MLPYQTIDLSMTHEHNDKLGTTLTNNPCFLDTLFVRLKRM